MYVQSAHSFPKRSDQTLVDLGKQADVGSAWSKCPAILCREPVDSVIAHGTVYNHLHVHARLVAQNLG